MYINVIWVAFRYSLRVFTSSIYSIRYVCYRFWALAVSIGTQSCKHCCQSMTLAHLTSKNRNSTYVYPGDLLFLFHFIHYNNFFPTTRTVKICILLWYNWGMCYRLSLLSTQSAQPLLRSDNFGSSQLLISRKDTRFVSRYAWTWRETLPCLLIIYRNKYDLIPLRKQKDNFQYFISFISLLYRLQMFY